MSDTELKPCPFCGGKAIPYNKHSFWWSVGCENENCFMFTNQNLTENKKQIAIEKWNKRVNQHE